MVRRCSGCEDGGGCFTVVVIRWWWKRKQEGAQTVGPYSHQGQRSALFKLHTD
ncbi:hypothetical protein Hanom_Chr14g01305211 [Helianthus anomalus]